MICTDKTIKECFKLVFFKTWTQALGAVLLGHTQYQVYIHVQALHYIHVVPVNACTLYI